jgi:MFS family permease
MMPSMETADPGKPASHQLAALFAAFFTSYFVLNSINVALPRISADLDGMPLYSWAISIPALVSAFLTLIFGKLSDMYGRRIIMLFSIASILLGAILCATSQNFVFLIGSLSVLSLGQGSVPPLCFSVLGDM